MGHYIRVVIAFYIVQLFQNAKYSALVERFLKPGNFHLEYHPSELFGSAASVTVIANVSKNEVESMPTILALLPTWSRAKPHRSFQFHFSPLKLVKAQ